MGGCRNEFYIGNGLMTAESFIILELERFLKSKNISDIPVILQKPKEEKFGDFATNLAMQLAKQLKSNPRSIAEEICQFVETGNQYIDKIEIAGPGFINFFTAHENLYEQLDRILSQRNDYGKSDLGKGKQAMVEFVSANPTGPLTIGHGRQAVLGDTIANLLEAIGYEVTREYYFNNAGRQMRMLGNSVYYRYLELLGETVKFPDDHYQGEYIKEIAQIVHDKHKDSLKDDQENDIFKNVAEQTIFEDIKKTVSRLGFSFDVFYNENSLYETGKIDEVIRAMDEKGYIEKREGAIWFLTTKLGTDQDRVYVKSTGEPTYRLPDTAYHI
jgi:arginyl-tRNA synthetase